MNKSVRLRLFHIIWKFCIKNLRIILELELCFLGDVGWLGQLGTSSLCHVLSHGKIGKC